jgi:hypothetical protein
MRQESVEVGGIVTRGVLTLERRDLLLDALTRFPDGDVTVTVEARRQKRTSPQNRFWHGVVIPLFAEHCGYDFDDMKDELALQLIPRELVDMATGEVRIVPGHTSKLNTAQFNELIERAQRLGAEMGIVIPDPNDIAA